MGVAVGNMIEPFVNKEFHMANCLHEFFFRREGSARFFFSTALLLSYFGSVYLQEFFLKGEVLTRNFFLCNFPLKEIFLGIVTPPPVMSNGPPLRCFLSRSTRHVGMLGRFGSGSPCIKFYNRFACV